MGPMTYTEVQEVLVATTERATRETKGERTRRRLLLEAISRFGERGFRNTSVSEIARSIGLTQAAAYAYYESKAELYRAAVDADTESLVAEVTDQLQGRNAREFLPAMVALFAGGLESHPLARRIMSGMDPDALERLMSLPALENAVQTLAGLLAEEQEAGSIRADIDPGQMAAGIQAIVFGLVMTTTQLGARPRQETIIGVLHALDSLVRPPT